MIEYTSFRNHFLIAMPNLLDPNFYHSVTFILEHTPEGAMGIVINHPLNVSLMEVLRHMNIDAGHSTLGMCPVYAGGPLQPERGFVLHNPHGHWQSSLKVSEDISITTSRDILEAIAENRGPEKAIVALGYAAWEGGQLEYEIAENSWLLTPPNLDIIFETPPELCWQMAAQRLLGVDITHVSNLSGHA